MPQVVMDESVRSYPQLIPPRIGYADLFDEGRSYVFDGNRVTAHFREGRNGVSRWRLHTINPDLSLVITDDLRVRGYTISRGQSQVHLVRKFKSVFDALKPLDEAI